VRPHAGLDLRRLHEEFVIDVARLGLSRARAIYSRRAAGIIAHGAFDSLRWRSWVSTTPPAALPSSRVQPSGAAHAEMGNRLPTTLARARAAGGGAGLAVVALGVLSVGIVANTVLFTAVRTAPPSAGHQSSVLISPLGAGAVVLAVACAGAAAVILCAGPRWLRRRLGKP